MVNISEDDFKFDMMSADDMQNIIMENAKEAAQAISSGPNVTQLTLAFNMLNTTMLQGYINTYESESMIFNEGGNDYLILDEDVKNAVVQNITAQNYKNTTSALINASPELSSYASMLSILQDSDYNSLAQAVKASFNAYYESVFENGENYTTAEGRQLKKILYSKHDFSMGSTTTTITLYGRNNAAQNADLNAFLLANPVLNSQSLITNSLLADDSVTNTNTVVNNVVNNFATLMVAKSIGTSVGKIMEPMSDSLSGLGDKFSGDIFEFDSDKFKEAFKFDMNEDELSRLMSSMIKSSSATYANNLKNLGYQDIDEPSNISFYFKDFDSKNHFMDVLDDYNDNVSEEKKIAYSDITGLMMSSVSTIIDSVTYVLIAFVSISLIVSSIMIAVITLISVMERTKEIGILRAMGASKKNVSSIFTAETFIIGFLSGSLGIGVSYLLLIPINMVIHNINSDITAVLDIRFAIILILISVILTLVSGLMPSRKAAKQDPVIALRSE